MTVVEADIETRMCFTGNEIDGLVADIDRDKFEIGWIEEFAALIERLRVERGNKCDDAAHGIVGAMRIGDVALLAHHDEGAVERAAAADLDRVAERIDIAGLRKNA